MIYTIHTIYHRFIRLSDAYFVFSSNAKDVKKGSKMIHEKNLQTLVVEIYKIINHLNPAYMREIFIKKEISYDLRIRQLCRLPIVNSKTFGASTLAFRGSLLWNTLNDEIKLLNPIQKFRK